MKRFGLIGYPLEHSFSKEYFTRKFENAGLFDHHYNLFPLKSLREFPLLLNKYQELKGLNVTIPYKTEIITYLDMVDKTAETIGAVNTIRIDEGQRTTGYNTDVLGFMDSLRPLLESYHKKALILGTGGAARAVSYGLEQLEVDYTWVSRSHERGDVVYTQLDKEIIRQHQIIINATPVGMSPNTDKAPPLPYKAIGEKHLLYDLIYNPKKTLFLERGAEEGATIKNGEEMLYRQAEHAWDIWNMDIPVPSGEE